MDAYSFSILDLRDPYPPFPHSHRRYTYQGFFTVEAIQIDQREKCTPLIARDHLDSE